MDTVAPLRPDEEQLAGEWISVDGKVVKDETTRRIEELIAQDLVRVATAYNGWETLFLDQRDGRKWELTYPQSDLHGGGPPTLTCVTEAYTKLKYGEIHESF